MDRSVLARECVEIERAGGSVRDYLRERGFISPWGTWYRLQKEELHRKEHEITYGRENTMATKVSLEQKKKAVQIALDGGNPFDFLSDCGSKEPAGLWWTIKQNLKKVDPETYAKLPAMLPKKEPVKKTVKKPNIIPPEEREAHNEERLKEAEKRGLGQEEKRNILPGLPEKAQMELGLMDERVNTTSEDLPKIPDGEEKQEITKPAGYFPKLAEPVLPTNLPQMFPGFQVTAINGKFGQYRVGVDPSGKEAYFDFDGLDFDTQIRMQQHDLAAFVEELTRAAQILGVKN